MLNLRKALLAERLLPIVPNPVISAKVLSLGYRFEVGVIRFHSETYSLWNLLTADAFPSNKISNPSNLVLKNFH